MAKRILRPVRIILIALLIPGITNCSKENHSSEGSQGTGGGFVAYSTPEEVNTALDKALDLATEPRPEKNIYAQFWKYFGRNLKPDFINTPKHIFPRISGPADGSVDLDRNGDIYNSPSLKALKINKLTRLPSGDCLKSSVFHHNDASVSSFSINADICISIGNLTRIPPKSLLREILGLLLHEASHLGGAEEAEARAWQGAFINYFAERFGEIEYDSVGSDTRRILGKAKDLVADVKTIAVKNPNDPRIFSRMGELADQLADLPYYSDTLALELKTNALKPNLINNFSYSVFVVLQKIKIRFVIKSDFIRVKGIGIPLDFMPADKVVPYLNDIATDLIQLEQNFSAFVSGPPEARSKCVKPDASGDLNQFPVRPPGKNPNTIERKCVDDM